MSYIILKQNTRTFALYRDKITTSEINKLKQNYTVVIIE